MSRNILAVVVSGLVAGVVTITASAVYAQPTVDPGRQAAGARAVVTDAAVASKGKAASSGGGRAIGVTNKAIAAPGGQTGVDCFFLENNNHPDCRR